MNIKEVRRVIKRYAPEGLAVAISVSSLVGSGHLLNEFQNKNSEEVEVIKEGRRFYPEIEASTLSEAQVNLDNAPTKEGRMAAYSIVDDNNQAKKARDRHYWKSVLEKGIYPGKILDVLGSAASATVSVLAASYLITRIIERVANQDRQRQSQKA